MTSRRYQLALLYMAAVLAAPGAHEHGHGDHAPAPLEACADGGVHLADHPDAPDLGHPALHCVGCQLQDQPGTAPASAGLDALPARVTLEAVPRGAVPARPAGASRPRAPPCA